MYRSARGVTRIGRIECRVSGWQHVAPNQPRIDLCHDAGQGVMLDVLLNCNGVLIHNGTVAVAVPVHEMIKLALRVAPSLLITPANPV